MRCKIRCLRPSDTIIWKSNHPNPLGNSARICVRACVCKNEWQLVYLWQFEIVWQCRPCCQSRSGPNFGQPTLQVVTSPVLLLRTFEGREGAFGPKKNFYCHFCTRGHFSFVSSPHVMQLGRESNGRRGVMRNFYALGHMVAGRGDHMTGEGDIELEVWCFAFMKIEITL